MAKRMCSVENCDRPHNGKGFCLMHYLRWRKSGDPGPAEPIPARTRLECAVEGCSRLSLKRRFCNPHWLRYYRHGDPGPAEVNQPITDCRVAGCDKPHRSNGYCTKHYQRWRHHGDPEFERVEPNRYVGDAAQYGAVHYRLYKLRGRPSLYRCDHCGGEAKEWAYDHTDSDERLSARQRPYSVDPARYMPLCRPCHRKFDATSIR